MSLTDPCLSYVYSEGYRPLAGLVAMVSVLVVVAIESCLAAKGAGHSHSHEMFDEPGSEEAIGERGYGLAPGGIELRNNESSQRLVAKAAPLPQSPSPLAPTNNANASRGTGADVFDDDDDSDLEGGIELTGSELRGLTQEDPQEGHQASKLILSSSNTGQISDEERRKLQLQCFLLEAGIVFHSVFIGMSLSVATGPNFVVFLIAICFHQCFEGIALGSRIVGIQHPRSSWTPWGMVLVFGLTTPVGQAIGLYFHTRFDPLSQEGLLIVGFTNAISSGLLLFAGIHQLLAQDFLSEKSFRALRGWRRVFAFVAVIAGSALMAGVGAIA